MYSGDEFYGDDVTSPLYRPLPPRRLTEGERDILREQEADARPARPEPGVCLSCGGSGVVIVGWDGWCDIPAEYGACPDCDGTGKYDPMDEAADRAEARFDSVRVL